MGAYERESFVLLFGSYSFGVRSSDTVYVFYVQKKLRPQPASQIISSIRPSSNLNDLKYYQIFN